jgi:hypothetical protein
MVITGKVISVHAHFFAEVAGGRETIEDISRSGSIFVAEPKPNYYSIQVLDWKRNMLHFECFRVSLWPRMTELNINDEVQVSFTVLSQQVGARFFTHLHIQDLFKLSKKK